MRRQLDYQKILEQLYATNNQQQVFNVLHTYVLELGYDGVLYSFFPSLMLNPEIKARPFYSASPGYDKSFLDMYVTQGYYRHDFALQQMMAGAKEPIGWWESRQHMEPEEAMILRKAKKHGLNQGVVLPLHSGPEGIAGASVVSYESDETKYAKLKEEAEETLYSLCRLVHMFMMDNERNYSPFIMPLIDILSPTQQVVLKASLAYVQSPEYSFSLRNVAHSSGINERTCRNHWDHIRTKLGVDSIQSVIYHAGLLKMIKVFEFKDSQDNSSS